MQFYAFQPRLVRAIIRTAYISLWTTCILYDALKWGGLFSPSQLTLVSNHGLVVMPNIPRLHLHNSRGAAADQISILHAKSKHTIASTLVDTVPTWKVLRRSARHSGLYSVCTVYGKGRICTLLYGLHTKKICVAY